MGKDLQLHLMIDEAGRKQIEQRMESAGIRNMSAYVRKMALNGYIIRLDFPELREVLRLMQISSNNLNQYARKANETGSIYRDDIEDLRENQKKLLQLMGELLDRVRRLDGEGA